MWATASVVVKLVKGVATRLYMCKISGQRSYISPAHDDGVGLVGTELQPHVTPHSLFA
jgi:hypothetical protein